jgi:dUTP pyrophosphatase
MLNIKIKPTHTNFIPPTKGSEYAACWDVYAADIKRIDFGKYEVDLGFATEIPEGYKGVIVPRSSITKTELIMQNSPAQIDSDYRGNWKIKFLYMIDVGDNDFPYQVGDRVAQIYFEKVEPFNWDLVNILSDTNRGSGGFGSTGK